MPLLRHVLSAASDRSHALLRAKALECISLVGMAVGREQFRDDAHAVMQLMQSLQARKLGSPSCTRAALCRARLAAQHLLQHLECTHRHMHSTPSFSSCRACRRARTASQAPKRHPGSTLQGMTGPCCWTLAGCAWTAHTIHSMPFAEPVLASSTGTAGDGNSILSPEHDLLHAPLGSTKGAVGARQACRGL